MLFCGDGVAICSSDRLEWGGFVCQSFIRVRFSFPGHVSKASRFCLIPRAEICLAISPGNHKKTVPPRFKRRGKYYDVFDPSAPLHHHESGRRELQSYANHMLSELVRHEEMRPCDSLGPPTPSGLRMFARLDILVLQEQTQGKFHFWLSEVERGHGARLFSTAAGGLADRWAPSLVHLWERMILEKRRDRSDDEE